jgi:hypothetical protein
MVHRKEILEVLLRLPVVEFIGKMVRHIPEKHHRMIRYSGIFGSRVKVEKLGLVWAALEEGGRRSMRQGLCVSGGKESRSGRGWIHTGVRVER